MLTPEEFKNTMQRILDRWEPSEERFRKAHFVDPHDPEMCHRTMDNLMAKLLCDLGYEDGIDIFKKALKWYA